MFEQAFKNIDDVLWKEAGCSSELDYTEQTSWLLFLKYLDDLETDRVTEAAPERRMMDPPLSSVRMSRPEAGSCTTQKLRRSGASVPAGLFVTRTVLSA